MMFCGIKKVIILAHDAYLLCEFVHLYPIESIFTFCYEESKTEVIFFYLLPCSWVEMFYLLDFKWPIRFFPNLFQLIRVVTEIQELEQLFQCHTGNRCFCYTSDYLEIIQLMQILVYSVLLFSWIPCKMHISK